MTTHSRNIVIITVLIIGFFAFNWFNNSQQALAPELNFTDINGQAHSLRDYQGKPVLVVFWATDCPGCIAEMPELIKLHNEYSEQGLTIIGVAMAHDTIKHIKAMQAAKGLPYTLTWDHSSSIAQDFNNVRVTPTHFLIAPSGEIIMRKIGSLNMEYLHNKLHNMGLNKS